MRAVLRVRRVVARVLGGLLYVVPPLAAVVAALRPEPSLRSGAVAVLVALIAVLLAGPMGSLAEVLDPAGVAWTPGRSFDVRGSAGRAPQVAPMDLLRDLDGYLDARSMKLVSAEAVLGGRKFATVMAAVWPPRQWPWGEPDVGGAFADDPRRRLLPVVARSAGPNLWPQPVARRLRFAPSSGGLGYPEVELFPQRFGGLVDGVASPRGDGPPSGRSWSEGWDLVPLDHEGLVRPWFVERGKRDALAAVLNARAVAALNTYGQDHVAVALRSDSVTAFSDGEVGDLVASKVASLSAALFAAREGALGAGPVNAVDDIDKNARALAASAGGSAALRGKESRGAAGLITIGLMTAVAIFVAIDAAVGADGSVASNAHRPMDSWAWLMAAAPAFCLALVGLLALTLDRGFDTRRVAMAKQVLGLVREHGWRVQESAPSMLTPVTLTARRGIRSVAVAPVAVGAPEGGLRAGVAFLAWDSGWWPLLRGRSAYAVWVESERLLPTFEVVGGHSGELGVLFGTQEPQVGGGLALARPGVGEALSELRSERLVIRCDGRRLVAWDRDKASIDLATRVAAMMRLAQAVA